MNRILIILTSPISLGLLSLALVVIFFWGFGIIIVGALQTLFDFLRQYLKNRRLKKMLAEEYFKGWKYEQE